MSDQDDSIKGPYTKPRSRAVCTTCDWAGEWQKSEWQAQKDKEHHEHAFPDHKTDIIFTEKPDL